jgi:hypothetical protein
MLATGIVPLDSAHAFRAFPGLWPSAEAARKAYQRGEVRDIANREVFSKKCPAPLARYRLSGAGQRPAEAVVDMDLVPDPRAWLEQRLGPLAHFDMEDVPGAVAPADAERVAPVEAVAAPAQAMAVAPQVQPPTPPVIRVLPRPEQPLPNPKTRTTHWETKESVLLDPSDLYPAGVLVPPVIGLFRVGDRRLVEQFQPPPLPKDDPRMVSLAIRIAKAVTAPGGGLARKPPILASALAL